MDGWMNGQTEEGLDKWISISQWMDEWISWLMNGWIDKWISLWIGEWIGRLMEA